MNPESLFNQLYEARTESDVDRIVAKTRSLQDPKNWKPYGQNESNFGVVENQQASPVPALVEKVINSIDAILTRACLERNIDPKSQDAPRSIEDAVEEFFPDAQDWDLPNRRQEQSERIQIIADGPRMETSLTIYDDGEGQHPHDFEDTFLSLLRGNKNEIHFVQGKYNMGGAGAIAFCGKKRYQLVGSRRWDESGDFGFTLVRRHPLDDQEKKTRRATWYEYFVSNSVIPSFRVKGLDLGLRNRFFTTGTVIKLYSYDLPAGTRSVISRDLNQSINEYLFSPALPLYTIDTLERYPDDRNVQRDLYGLKHRLEMDDSRYVAEFFSEELMSQRMGLAKVVVYVFKPRVDDRTPKETRETIRREFFKNNMSVMFSVNGQVHGHYTSEFITRSLKYHILKDYLLIHVDCTGMDVDFRNELFMASRDRLKDGSESRELRSGLSRVLTSGRLKEVYKERKSAISVESNDTDDLLRSFAKSLPFRDDLMRLLDDTMALDDKRDGRRPRRDQSQTRNKKQARRRRSASQRFPSFLKLEHASRDGGVPMVQVPRNGTRTIRFSTDVEDQYFDRVSEPGDLTIAILDHAKTGRRRQNPGPRPPNHVSELLNVVKSSPHDGTIRVTMSPTEEVSVGDDIKVRANLSGAGEDFEEIFFVNISEQERPSVKREDADEPALESGLPKLVLVHKERTDGVPGWDELGASGVEMGHDVVVYPMVDDKDLLEKIFINMDSRVLLDHRSKLSTAEQIEVAQKRYISAVYFHTLFLYGITKNRKYSLQKSVDAKESLQEVTVGEYLKDVFESHYAEFLLNFEVQELIGALEG